MKKVNYDVLAVYLNGLCQSYNSAFINDDDFNINLNRGLIRGFILCLDGLGISYTFTGNEIYKGFFAFNEIIKSFNFDGKNYIVSD